jgi:hypothetical protein
MFEKTLAKTDMLKFWEYMFEFCKEDFSCFLGWLLAGILGFLAIIVAFGVVVTRLNKRDQ